MLDMMARESALFNTDDMPVRTMKKRVATQTIMTVDGSSGLVAQMRKEPVVEEYTTHPEPDPTLYSPVKRDSKHIPLAALPSMRRQFSIPWYQREGIWEYEDKVRFLLMILHGIPVSAIMVDCYKNEQGYPIKDILDGQQRLFEAILPYMAGEFKMPSEAQYERFTGGGKLPLLGEKCSYEKLPYHLKSAFDNYSLEFIYMEDLPRAWVTPIFRELQRARKLTLGQMLWANENKTAELARELSHYASHPIWSVVFKRSSKTRPVESDKPRLRYQAVLTAMLVELTSAPFTFPCKKEDLDKFASGVCDPLLLTNEEGNFLLESQITRQFDSITQVFPGADANSRLDMLTMGQLVAIMERGYGYDLRYAPRGYYTQWLKDRRAERRMAGKKSFSAVSFLGERIEQERFWEVQLPPLLARAEKDGLVKASQVDEAYLAELATSGV